MPVIAVKKTKQGTPVKLTFSPHSCNSYTNISPCHKVWLKLFKIKHYKQSENHFSIFCSISPRMVTIYFCLTLLLNRHACVWEWNTHTRIIFVALCNFNKDVLCPRMLSAQSTQKCHGQTFNMVQKGWYCPWPRSHADKAETAEMVFAQRDKLCGELHLLLNNIMTDPPCTLTFSPALTLPWIKGNCNAGLKSDAHILTVWSGTYIILLSLFLPLLNWHLCCCLPTTRLAHQQLLFHFKLIPLN